MRLTYKIKEIRQKQLRRDYCDKAWKYGLSSEKTKKAAEKLEKKI